MYVLLIGYRLMLIRELTAKSFITTEGLIISLNAARRISPTCDYFGNFFCSDVPHEGMAGAALSLGSDVGRGGRQLRDFFGERNARGAVPLRCGGGESRDGAHRLARADGSGLARLRAGGQAGATLRLQD